MNTLRPPWNAHRKPESLLRCAKWFNTQARGTYLKDKTHVNLFILLQDDGQGALCPAIPELTKDQLAEAIREMVAEHKFYAVLHIFEGWAYLSKRAGDHTFRQIVDGELGVSDLQDGDKTEALFVSVESRDGLSCLWLNPIVRDGEAVSLSDALEINDPPKGRLAGWFAPPADAE